MKVPTLTILDLHDKRYRFDQYWDSLENINVPTPKTIIIPVDDSNTIPDCPTDEIMSFMQDNELYKAFIRTGYKAAIDRFRDGSIIQSRDKEVIEKTVESLFTQHVRNEIPHGNILVVREALDLDYCMEANHSHTVEIRYFIDDGEIIGQTPDYQEEELVPDCPMTYSFIQSRFNNVSDPVYLAERVASEFADSKYSWSFDIILDAYGEWWVTEMHINGVYWNDVFGKWMNNCGHGDIPHLSPKWFHQSALPDLSK